MTMNGAVLPVLAGFIVAARGAGRARRTSSPARSRTTSSRSSWSATPISIRPRPRCASSPTSSNTRREHMPKFNSISISGYHMQEAGATAVQELAFTLADGLEYVRAALAQRARRRRIRAAAVVLLRHRHEFLHGGRQAARRAAAVGAAHAAVRAEEPGEPGAAHALPDLGRVSSPSRTRTTTSCAPRSRRWPRCSAARSRCTPIPSTRRMALPTPFSARIARNTQLILAEETGITHVVDPLGGSYYVESLTHSLADGGDGADRRGRGAGRHDQGGRGRHAQAAHRGSGGAAPGARSTAARTSIVGVNKYQLRRGRRDRHARHRQRAVRDAQIARLDAGPRTAATRRVSRPRSTR